MCSGFAAVFGGCSQRIASASKKRTGLRSGIVASGLTRHRTGPTAILRNPTSEAN